MKLSKRALALSSGILWGACVFLTTLYVLIKGGGNTLVLLQQFYWGYSISVGGAFLGLIYGFIDGFICGWLFGLLYNAFVACWAKKKKE